MPQYEERQALSQTSDIMNDDDREGFIFHLLSYNISSTVCLKKFCSLLMVMDVFECGFFSFFRVSTIYNEILIYHKK